MRSESKNKHMFTAKFKKVTLVRRFSAAVALGFLVAFSTSPAVKIVTATATCSTTSECQSKINSTSNSIASSQAQLSVLAGQASTYQQAINDLQTQINAVQAQIDANEAQQASLQKQINDAQAQLDQQKAILADIVRATYIDGQMSTIEALATSNNLSDYVDKEAYRQQVNMAIQDSMTKIAALQAQLQTKKQAVDELLAEQQGQANQLQAYKAQQASMLSYTKSQQAAYNSQLASSSSDLKALQNRLAALNTTSDSKIIMSGTCGGGYPAKATAIYFSASIKGAYWGCNYGQDSSYDNWHMQNRECVSYTAYMVSSKYGISTSGWGNAYQWISKARSLGYSVDQTPRAGDIAIRDRDYSEAGDVGHAMYVVSARSSSDITVWEYNRHYDGTFDERSFNPHSYSAPVYYIHFQDGN